MFPSHSLSISLSWTQSTRLKFGGYLCELTDGYHPRPRQIKALNLLYSLGKYKTEESIVPYTGFFMTFPVCYGESLLP